MESALLGLAAPVVAGSAGNLLEGTLRTAAAPFAALLDAITSAMTSKGEEEQPVTVESLQDNLGALRFELATRIEKTLTRAGIDLSEPIEIRLSPADGRLEIVGDHPQKALIEAALGDDPNLGNDFNEIAGVDHLLKAMNDESDTTDGAALGEAKQDAVTAVFSIDSDGPTLKFK